MDKVELIRLLGRMIDDSKQYVTTQWGRVGETSVQNEIYYEQGVQEGLRKAIKLIRDEVNHVQ